MGVGIRSKSHDLYKWQKRTGVKLWPGLKKRARTQIYGYFVVEKCYISGFPDSGLIIAI